MRGLCLIVVVLLLGCDDIGSGSTATPLVLAAASTGTAVREIVKRYETASGVAVTVTTAGSNALAQQILAGAPGQIFLSANSKWIDSLEKEGLVLAREILFSNSLVMVVPKGNPLSVTHPSQLGASSRVALAGKQVPAGMYAEQALRSIGIYESLDESGSVVRGTDVRTALVYVEVGEVDAGIVYATDALASQAVEVVYTFAEGTHERIVYELVLLLGAEDNQPARELFEFMLGSEARSIFVAHGFVASDDQAQGRTQSGSGDLGEDAS